MGKALAVWRRRVKCGGKALGNDEMRKLEEALPRLKECEFGKVSRLYKAKTSVGCDGFHPKVLLNLTRETRGEIVEFLEKVEQSGKLAQRCSSWYQSMSRVRGQWRFCRR